MTNCDRYDHQDFISNPGKYKIFKTARVAGNIFTHNGEQDLAAGTFVAIKYLCTARNQMYRRNEPVYSIIGHDRDLYANALSNFVL